MNLEKVITYLDQEYREGNSLISDKVFDGLEKKLKLENPGCDYFNKRLHLPSLEKGTLEEFADGLDENTKVIMQPKIDGVAVAIQYEDGKIKKAITRKGKDITDKMKMIKSVPLQVLTKESLLIRGELYDPYKNKEPAISQRKAAGYLRSKSFCPDPNLTFCAFEIINKDYDEINVKHELKKQGFIIIQTYILTIDLNRQIINLNFSNNYMYQPYQQEKLNDVFFSVFKRDLHKYFPWYPKDGIVLKINSRKEQLAREKQYDLFPYSKIAIKY